MSNSYNGSIEDLLLETFGEDYKKCLVKLSSKSITLKLNLTSQCKNFYVTTLQVQKIYKLRAQYKQKFDIDTAG